MVDVNDVICWVKEAGQIALAHAGRTAGSAKPDGTLVTDTDKSVESFLRKKIQSVCPRHDILGEELGQSRKKDEREFCWALDPIDGTVNFAMGLPFWGISVGLMKNNIPVLGVIYLPRLDEVYWAEERKGAHLNGARCRVASGVRSHDEALVIVPSCSQKFQYRFPHKIRSFGSAAAHLCYVARGLCIGALLEGWNVWDVAAGLCILREAGAIVTDLNGVPVISLKGSVGMPLLVASPVYHSDLLSGIKYYPAGK